MNVELQWHSFMIPGVFFMALGVIGVGTWGIGPLTVGAMAAGFFLLLAAVLKALGDRSSVE